MAAGARQAVRTVLAFDETDAADAELLGGKGASLVRMRALGLPVPPGFVITTTVCHEFLDGGVLPESTWAAVIDRLGALEAALGRSFGNRERPLLVSVRSGAPVSMPGMMDTVLDIGLNAASLGALVSSGAEFGWNTYARLVRMYGTTVAGIPGRLFEDARLDALAATTDAASPQTAKDIAARYLAVFAAHADRPFPDDPLEQLRGAIEAVFRSWNSPRAQRYRGYAGISDSLGTAVVVQAMVFGNRDAQSGTGVAFTRDPATGAPGAYGDFLVQAQGEDVVAGEETPGDLDECARIAPAAHGELLAVTAVLERAYRDMCDIEFTVETGRLWVLQVRPGQRTALAAVRIALDLVDEGVLDLDEAMRRVPAAALLRLRDPVFDPEAERVLLGRGVAASPGAATGCIAQTAAAAEAIAARGESAVLVRPYTSPDDIAGFIAASGIVTAHGGRTSHAAVVARGMNRPAVCGIEGLTFSGEACAFPGGTVTAGHEISLDGGRGEVYRGRVPMVQRPHEPRVDALLARCDERRRVPVHAEGDAVAVMLADPGTARCASTAEVEEAADDQGIRTIIIDPGSATDPAGFLRELPAAVGELDAELMVLIDGDWPAAVGTLPRLPWRGVVAGPGAAWAARLLAATLPMADGV